jgi:hypothetical protein
VLALVLVSCKILTVSDLGGKSCLENRESEHWCWCTHMDCVVQECGGVSSEVRPRGREGPSERSTSPFELTLVHLRSHTRAPECISASCAGSQLHPCLCFWSPQAFRLQSLKAATTTEGFIAALGMLIATPDADKAAVVQAALKCKREHKVRKGGTCRVRQGCA